MRSTENMSSPDKNLGRSMETGNNPQIVYAYAYSVCLSTQGGWYAKPRLVWRHVFSGERYGNRFENVSHVHVTCHSAAPEADSAVQMPCTQSGRKGLICERSNSVHAHRRTDSRASGCPVISYRKDEVRLVRSSTCRTEQPYVRVLCFQLLYLLPATNPAILHYFSK